MAFKAKTNQMIRSRKKPSRVPHKDRAEEKNPSMSQDNTRQRRCLARLAPMLFLSLGFVYFFVDPRFSDHRPIGGNPCYPRRTAKKAALIYRKNIADHVFLITGAYGSIGKATTEALLKEGAKVIAAGRNQHKLFDLGRELGGNIEGHTVDLADLASVRSFAHRILAQFNSTQTKISIINNAAVIAPAASTKQGLELQMGTNVVGHFLLNKILLPITKRQVWLSSTSHQLLGSPRLDLPYQQQWSLENDSATYDPWWAYQQSKLAAILIATEFHRRYHPTLETASVHPGVVWSTMGKDIYDSNWWGPIYDSIMELSWLIGTEGWWFVKTSGEGAATSVTAVADPDIDSGGYYRDSVPYPVSGSAQNSADAQAIFEWCNQVTKEYQ